MVSSVGMSPHLSPAMATDVMPIKLTRPCIELRLIEENADLKRVGDELMTSIIRQLRRTHLDVQLGVQEQLTALEAQAKAAENQNSVSFLSTISSAVLSLFTLGAGATTGNGYLIASGATGLANTLITSFDAWDTISEVLAFGNEVAQNQIRTLMPLTMTLMSFALGFNGTQLAGQDSQAMLRSLQHLKAYTFGAVQAGQAYVTYEKGKTETQFITSEQALARQEKKVAALGRELKIWMDLFRQISNHSKQAVKQAMRETSSIAGG